MQDSGQQGNTTKPRRGKVARAGISIIRVAFFGYATILVTLVVMETRIVYPAAYMNDRPSAPEDSQPSPIIDVDYQASDNVSLRGRLLIRENSPNTVLYFHGNGTKAKWLDDWLLRLSQEFDATVMAAEYRGYQPGSQKPNEKGVILDCIAARDFLCQRQRLRADDVILYGRSLGGACAVAVAADGGAKALVLDRTFDRMVDVAAGRFPFVPVRLLMRNSYDSVQRMGKYDGPLIQLHGTHDSVIPMSHGEKLYAAATSRQKHWIELTGAGHNDRLSPAQLRQVIDKIAFFTDQVDVLP